MNRNNKRFDNRALASGRDTEVTYREKNTDYEMDVHRNPYAGGYVATVSKNTGFLGITKAHCTWRGAKLAAQRGQFGFASSKRVADGRRVAAYGSGNLSTHVFRMRSRYAALVFNHGVPDESEKRLQITKGYRTLREAKAAAARLN